MKVVVSFIVCFIAQMSISCVHSGRTTGMGIIMRGRELQGGEWNYKEGRGLREEGGITKRGGITRMGKKLQGGGDDKEGGGVTRRGKGLQGGGL